MKPFELNTILLALEKKIGCVPECKLTSVINKLCDLESHILLESDIALLERISNKLANSKETESIGIKLENKLADLLKNDNFSIEEIESKLINNSKDKQNAPANYEQLNLEKLKIIAKVLTVAITVCVGTFGVAFINDQTQRSKLELQARKDKAAIQKTEMEYLGSLLENALSDDNKKRFLFSEYYAELTVSPDLRTNWQNYHKKIQSDTSAYNSLKKEYNNAQQQGHIKEVERLTQELKAIQQRLKPVIGDKASLLKTRKIIHLSDINVKSNNDERSQIECIINNVINEAKPSSEYVIVITGDLTGIPTESNFVVIKNQLNKFIDKGYRVLLVGGNHDFAAEGNFYKQEYRHLFNKIVLEKKEEENVVYPILDIIDDTAFIGLDTMAGRSSSPFEFATGEIGKEQLTRLDSLLSNQDVTTAKYKVLYMHHSPFLSDQFMGLKDSKSLQKVLQKYSNIDLMLFGNSHNFTHYNGRWNIERNYDAGSSTSGTSFTRIIDLSKDSEYDLRMNFLCKNSSL